MKLLDDVDLNNFASNFEEQQQLLLICIKLSDYDMGLEEEEEYVWDLEKKLIAKTNNCAFAHYDGHEWGGGFAKIFIYSSDVNKLYQHLYKTLKKFKFTQKSEIVLQYKLEPIDQFVINPNKLPD